MSHSRCGKGQKAAEACGAQLCKTGKAGAASVEVVSARGKFKSRESSIWLTVSTV